MEEKVKRRAVLGTVVAGLAAGPFVIRYLRSGNTGLDVAESRKVEPMFSSAILPEMPDISHLEKEFEAVISLAPLALARNTVRRLRYKTTASGGMQLVNQGTLDDHRKVKTPSQACYREVIYLPPDKAGVSEREDVVVYDQNVSIEGVQPSAEMRKLFNTKFKITFDGLILEPTPKDEHLRQVSPMYLSVPVGNGSTWVQTSLADSRLNPGGSIETKFEVLGTYKKDGERFMRISSDLTYWSYQPVVDNISGLISSDGNTENTIRSRIISVSDFNVDRGIDTFSRGIQMIYSEKCPHAGGEDMFMITFNETTLANVA